MIRAVSAIIFWFPRLCHLSERLRSSGGRTREAKRHPSAAVCVASRSIRCHGADVIGGRSSSPQPQRDAEDQMALIIHSG